MRVLVNPDWADLLDPLDADVFKKIVMCMIKFPERECDHFIWNFIKKELVRNAENYNKQVDCLTKNRQKRWTSEQTEQTSVQTKNLSAVIDSKEKIDINNKNKKKDIDLLLNKFGKNFSPNAPKKYRINDDFSFEKLAEDDLEFNDFYSNCESYKLTRADQSLRYKHFEDYFTAKQIIGWIKNEGNFL